MQGETTCRLDAFRARESVRMKPTEIHQSRKRDNSWMQGLKIMTLSVAMLIALCMEADAQQPLSTGEINNQIIGQSFQGRKGFLSVELHYAKDGTVTMRSPLGTGDGSWTLSNNQLCIKLETGPRRVNECLTFVRQPDGAYRASNGMRLSPVE